MHLNVMPEFLSGQLVVGSWQLAVGSWQLAVGSFGKALPLGCAFFCAPSLAEAGKEPFENWQIMGCMVYFVLLFIHNVSQCKTKELL